jgi:hypothetical protein
MNFTPNNPILNAIVALCGLAAFLPFLFAATDRTNQLEERNLEGTPRPSTNKTMMTQLMAFAIGLVIIGLVHWHAALIASSLAILGLLFCIGLSGLLWRMRCLPILVCLPISLGLGLLTSNALAFLILGR